MGMGDAGGREFIELPWFERVEHAHVADRQGDGGFGLAFEQANGFPAWRIVLAADAALEPDRGAGDQERMQARRVAGAFVEQVLQAAADFDRENIDERVGRAAAEPEPETIGKGAHAGGARNFQRGCVVFAGGTRPRFQPDAVTAGVGHFEARWGLRPGPNAFAHVAVECLKTHHF